MRFSFVDRIVEFSPRTRIVAIRAVTLGEEYLADHFPTFPILPGVLMLQVMVEAAGWLFQEAEAFQAGPLLLHEVKSITYRNFVKPGSLLRAEVAARRLTKEEGEFEGTGFCETEEVIRGRFGLRPLKPSEGPPAGVWAAYEVDARVRFEALRR